MALHSLEEDFTSALNTIKDQIEESNVLLSEQKEITTEILSLQEATAKAVESKSESVDVITRQKNIAEMGAQNDTRRISKALGGIDRQVELASKARVAQDKALTELEDVKELQAITVEENGIFDFIAAQFQMGFEQDDVDRALQEVSIINSFITTNTANISAARDANNKIAEVKTTATIAAASDAAAEQAIIDSSAARLRSQLTKADQITKDMEASREETVLTIRRYQLGREKETTEALAAERKASREERTLDRAIRLKENAARAKQVQKAEDIDTAMVSAVNAGEIATEAAPSSRAEVLASLNLKGESRTRATALFNLGSRGVQSTPANTLEAFVLSNPTVLVNGSNPALTALRIIAKELPRAGTNGKAFTATQLSDSLNTTTKTVFEKFNKKISFKDHDNPNKAPPISALLRAESLQDNAFLQGIVAPLKHEDLSPEQLFKIATGSIGKEDPVSKKKITIEEAVRGITDLYSKALTQNNIQQDREVLGLPVQTDYNAVVNVPGIPSVSRRENILRAADDDLLIINLINPIEVKRTLIRFMNAKRSGSSVFDSL